jgi:hypothetical protein
MGSGREVKDLKDAHSVRDVTGSERCKMRDRYKRCERDMKGVRGVTDVRDMKET